MFEPAIKWSGSKRSQAEEIVNRIPMEIGTYYEPFCGGCSVLRRLLSSKEHRVNSFVCSDANSDLIDLWNSIRDCPEFIVQEYTQMWNELNKDNDLERKKVYFNHVRGEVQRNKVSTRLSVYHAYNHEWDAKVQQEREVQQRFPCYEKWN